MLSSIMNASGSERLIRALQQPGVLADPSEQVTLLQTHISWVLLAGRFAFKLKKPVDLGFLDFTSLEKRRFYCEEELRLNRRLAPDLYLDVVAITGTPEAPRLHGPGEAIEYAVRMKRFPQEALLSRVLDRGEIRPEHIDALARLVADFHERVPPVATNTLFGTRDDVLRAPKENLRYLAQRISDPQRTAQLERLRKWTDEEFITRREDFAKRRRDGFIRECHGDMHLGNMVLLDDDVKVFDCIEFNEAFRWIDVMSEVAFVVMDLEDRNLVDLSRRFLNAYLEWTGDYGGLIVLPFYFVYRALVRALVDVIRAKQIGESTSEQHKLEEEFQSYLDLAERWTRRPPPRLMITYGVTGSGKTTGTQALLESTGAIRVRSDVERKRLFGLRPNEPSKPAYGRRLYSRDATDRTYRRLSESATAAIRAGFSAIVDATFLTRRRRQRFRSLAEDLRVPFGILEFNADDVTLRQRIEQRLRRGRDASEATVGVLEDQLRAREPLDAAERVHLVPLPGRSVRN
jgi:aminoglycoside phosphotransferase family enzyme/predicted kinase